MPTFSDTFYAHLLDFPRMRELLGDSDTTARLRRAQSSYFSSLTGGEYGEAYVRERAVVGNFAAQVRAGTFAQLIHAQRTAAVERVHHQHAVIHRQTHQEMAGKRNPRQRDAQPARHFDLHHRQ